MSARQNSRSVAVWPPARPLNNGFQIRFAAASFAFSLAVGNLLKLYQRPSPGEDFLGYRRQLYTIALIYAQTIHPKVLSLAAKYKDISRNSLDAVVFLSSALLNEVVQGCHKADDFARVLDRVLQSVIREFNIFADTLAVAVQKGNDRQSGILASGGLRSGKRAVIPVDVANGRFRRWYTVLGRLGFSNTRPPGIGRYENSLAYQEILQLSAVFSEALQYSQFVISDIKTAVEGIRQIALSESLIYAIRSKRPHEVIHTELVGLRNALTEDVDKFRMEWEDLVVALISIGDTKAPNVANTLNAALTSLVKL